MVCCRKFTMAQHTAATVRTNSSALTNWVLRSLKRPSPLIPLYSTYTYSKLFHRSEALYMPPAFPRTIHENTGFHANAPTKSSPRLSVLGFCHYGKVYERNGAKCLRNKAFVKPIDKLSH